MPNLNTLKFQIKKLIFNFTTSNSETSSDFILLPKTLSSSPNSIILLYI